MGVGENLKRGTVELLLLAILQEGETYGYQLCQALASRSGGQFVLQEGSLYPTLYRLEKRGCISSRQEPVENSKRFRVYYRITPSGERYLAEIKEQYITINRGIFSVLGLEGLWDNERI